jgi:hypothetical protein
VVVRCTGSSLVPATKISFFVTSSIKSNQIFVPS